MQSPRIVFMGTPEFAVSSLRAIINAGYHVVGVVTAPDKPSGRGLQLHASPVKEFAVQQGLTVLQPLKLKDPVFLETLRALKPDIQVVVAFRMLPEEVWSLPLQGTFNLHASLLPQYRGAAPINRAVMNGEKKTGVTTFFINHEIDKGAIIYSRETEIGENENAGDVHDRLMMIGADLVVETIHGIVSGKLSPVDQQMVSITGELKQAPKIFREDCRVNWQNEIDELHNFIRGLSPFPAAWTELQAGNFNKLILKIYKAGRIREQHCLMPGEIVSDRKTYIHVAAANGFISLLRIQMQAKKQMSVEEFLRGFDITGLRFEV